MKKIEEILGFAVYIANAHIHLADNNMTTIA